MNSLTVFFLAAMLWLAGPAAADVARIAQLRNNDQLRITVTDEGTVAKTTVYLFTPNQVNISEGDKPIGIVSLRTEDMEQLDRYLDLVRKGRLGTGNGSTTYVISLTQDGRERRSMGEKHRIRLLDKAEGKVLPLSELHHRLMPKADIPKVDPPK